MRHVQTQTVVFFVPVMMAILEMALRAQVKILSPPVDEHCSS